MSADAVISRRAQAALASGVLALSAVGPAAAVAQEPDHQVEGGAGPATDEGTGETGSGSSDVPGSGLEAGITPPSTLAPPPAPDLDPQAPDGAESSELQEVVPIQTEPVEAPTGPGNSGSGVELEAAPGPVDPEAIAPDPVDGDSPAEPPEPSPPPTDAETPEAPVGPYPEGPSRGQIPEVAGYEETAETLPRDHTALPLAESPQPQTVPTPPAPALAPKAVLADASAARPAEPPAVSAPSDPAPPSGTSSGTDQLFLIVQPGDSLWAIAKRLLGPDASPAQIARKVSRLWTLNGDRIGTGRPDLLLVGTKLRLR